MGDLVERILSSWSERLGPSATHSSGSNPGRIGRSAPNEGHYPCCCSKSCGAHCRDQRAEPMNRTKYIDVCNGEMRISLHPDGSVSISGGSADPDKRKYQAIDGLRVKIGWLNQRLSDCIEATDALARQENSIR